jgi:hypothetical protein
MSNSAPDQEYITNLVTSIQAGERIEFSQLCTWLWAIIDAFCASLPERHGPGRHKTYSDSTILKIDMLM